MSSWLHHHEHNSLQLSDIKKLSLTGTQTLEVNRTGHLCFNEQCIAYLNFCAGAGGESARDPGHSPAAGDSSEAEGKALRRQDKG